MTLLSVDLVMGYVFAAAFVTLSVAALVSWARCRTRLCAHFALATGLLAAVSVLDKLHDRFAFSPRVLSVALVLAFLGSGYALLLLRGDLIALSRQARLVARGAFAAAAGVGLVFPPISDASLSLPELAASMVVFGVWCAFVVEPIARFWRTSRGCGAVQARRLRALSGGYGAFMGVVLVLFAVAAGGVGTSGGGASAGTVRLMLAVVVPLVALGLGGLYVGVIPPRWLRRAWREHEERALIAAARQLQAASDRRTVASNALAWAMRLLGANAGLVAAPDGEPLAAQGASDPSFLAWRCERTSTPGVCPGGASRVAWRASRYPPSRGEGRWPWSRARSLPRSGRRSSWCLRTTPLPRGWPSTG
ncbi:MAG: hypothetical protein WDA71_04335 [Actinomycetota bacterium]